MNVKKTSIFLISIFFSSIIASGNVSASPIKINNADAASSVVPVTVVGQGAYPDLAVDGKGNVHIVYYRSEQLFYKKYDPGNRTWSDEELVGPFTGVLKRNDPEIAADPQDYIHVFGGYYYRKKDNQWERVGDQIAHRDSGMAIDGKGNVYITTRGGNNGGYIGLKKLPAGLNTWVTLPDPDIANDLPIGRNDHVYTHIFTSPADSTIHAVYRHGAPEKFAYRPYLFW